MADFLTFFKDLGLRNKLFVSYASIFLFSISIGGYLSYQYTLGLIEKDVEERLRNANRSIIGLIRTSATVSIRNYLRAVAEKNIEFLHQVSKDSSDPEARADAARSLLRQKIGQNGFVYCLDEKGGLVVTPDRLKGANRYSGLPIQITRTPGYFEYREIDYSQNTSRPRADYSIDFPPWNWTVVISSFRDELSRLVQVDDFKSFISSYRFGRTGTSYILNANGALIIHPSLQGRDPVNHRDENVRLYIKKICRQKNGRLVYREMDPATHRAKERLAVFQYVSDINWIIVSEVCLEEFHGPLKSNSDADHQRLAGPDHPPDTDHLLVERFHNNPHQ